MILIHSETQKHLLHECLHVASTICIPMHAEVCPLPGRDAMTWIKSGTCIRSDASEQVVMQRLCMPVVENAIFVKPLRFFIYRGVLL